MELLIELDGRGPIYRQIYRSIRSAILEGRVGLGDRLPATRRLAESLGVSRTVVLLAFDQLTAEGYVQGRTGAGTFVAGDVPDRMLSVPGAAAEVAPGRPRRVSAVCSRLAESMSRLETRSGEAWIRHDLRVGSLAESDFPHRVWRKLLSRHGRRLSTRYGDAAGAPELRRALAAYLRRARAMRCEPEQVVITTGARQAFDLVARMVIDPGDRAVVEEPHYDGHRHALRAAGAELCPVAVDGAGLDPAGLPDSARLAFVTPSHQFPTGGIMPLGRRLALLEWADRAGAVVVEDDYDAEFQYEARPIESMQGLDRTGHVLYVGTLSKVLSPALRLGYVVAPRGWVEPFTRLKWLADRQTPDLAQHVATDFIAQGHLDRHLRRLRTRNAGRREALLAAVDRHFGSALEIVGAKAGVHVLAWLPDVTPDDLPAILAAAADAGVALDPITPHCLTPPDRAGLILGYAALEPAQIDAAVAALRRSVEPYL